LSFLTSLFRTGELFFTTKNEKVETEENGKTCFSVLNSEKIKKQTNKILLQIQFPTRIWLENGLYKMTNRNFSTIFTESGALLWRSFNNLYFSTSNLSLSIAEL